MKSYKEKEKRKRKGIESYKKYDSILYKAV